MTTYEVIATCLYPMLLGSAVATVIGCVRDHVTPISEWTPPEIDEPIEALYSDDRPV